MPIDPQRAKAIEAAIGSIERAFGKGAVMRLDSDTHVELDTISTGSLALDMALGVGGIPRGRVTEIYGPEASGKTTLALHCIAEAQKAGGVAAFIDAEHALDVSYARALGIHTEELLISQPDHGEQALEIADTLVRSGAIDMVVVDSVAALVPRAEIEGDMGDMQPGAQARLMSQALRKLTASIHKSNCAMVFINQVRYKIGVMYGNPETTSGGNALKFYASVRLDIRRIGGIKEGEQEVGNRVRVKIVKNKLAPPFRKVEFDVVFGKGISADGEVLDLAVAANLVRKSGSWYALDDDRIGQGRDNATAWLREHPDRRAALVQGIRAKHGLVLPGENGAEPAAD
ncbi:MAG: recombinase RecA [Deltaproteobacteria bacterium]|nr:recombinase RecA [Deltaproteobacteria bacterium]